MTKCEGDLPPIELVIALLQYNVELNRAYHQQDDLRACIMFSDVNIILCEKEMKDTKRFEEDVEQEGELELAAYLRILHFDIEENAEIAYRHNYIHDNEKLRKGY